MSNSTAALLVDRLRLEQASLRRNPQAAFFAILLPVALLLLLGLIDDPDEMVDGERVARLLLPGILAFGIIAATYVNLAVSLTAQRDEGILKRLRSTPLPLAAFVGGHVASVMVTTAGLTSIFLIAGKLRYDVTLPLAHAPAFVVVVALGTICFSALGLALTVLIRTAVAATPIANGTFFPLALLSGLFGADSQPTGTLGTFTGFFPVRALSEALRTSFSERSDGFGFDWPQLLNLVLWAAAGLLVSARWFRWAPRR